MNNFPKYIIDWIFPNYCILCQLKSNSGLLLCKTCILMLPWSNTSCYQCGARLEGNSDSKKNCGNCLQNKRFFDHTLAPWHYEAPINKYISRLKFNAALEHAKLLGTLLAEYIFIRKLSENLPRCLIPMPLHQSRLRQRGFNQAVEIARPIAKQLKIPLALNLCLRSKNTLPQTKLNGKERQRNLHNAFCVTTRQPMPIHVAIIDDVMTTSATANELSRTLKEGGVQRVEIWCCARA